MNKIIALLLLPVLILFIYLIFQTHLFITAAQHLPGKVVGYTTINKGIKDGKRYALNIEYFDKSGKKYAFTSQTSSSNPSKNIGDQIIVLVSIDGTEAKLFLYDELFQLFLIPLCICIAVECCLVGQDFMELLYM